MMLKDSDHELTVTNWGSGLANDTHYNGQWNWQGLTQYELPNHELRVDFVSQDGLFAISHFVPKLTR